jgi:hypothetical protein
VAHPRRPLPAEPEQPRQPEQSRDQGQPRVPPQRTMELEPQPQERPAPGPKGSRGSLPAGAAPLPPGDADLITASRGGDATAYDTLYRRHAAAARTLARQLVRGQAEADDVVAETFAKILDPLRRGGGPEGAFRPYLPPGGTGIVGFSVTNSGPAPALQVTANVSLPLGVSLMAGGTLGLDSTVHASPDGWTCVPDGAGARCTHGPLAAATSTASYLLVAVAPGAPAGGRPPRFAAPGWYAALTAPARIRRGLWAAVPTAFSKYCIRMRPKLQQSRT